MIHYFLKSRLYFSAVVRRVDSGSGDLSGNIPAQVGPNIPEDFIGQRLE